MRKQTPIWRMLCACLVMCAIALATSVAAPREALAAQYRTLEGKAYAVLDLNTNEVVFTRSYEEHTTNGPETLTSVTGKVYTGLIATNVEEYNPDWGYVKSRMYSVSVEDGVLIRPKSLTEYFKNSYSLATCDLNGFSYEQVSNTRSMFENCHALKGANLYSAYGNGKTSLDQNSIYDMSYMFANCYRLTSTPLMGINTSNVEYMNHMFYMCQNLKHIDMLHNNFGKVRTMSHMFEYCYVLDKVQASYFWTGQSNRAVYVPSLEDCSYMFHFCPALQYADLSNWQTPNLKNMYQMFSDTYQLRTLDLSNWNFANVPVDKAMLRTSADSSLNTLILRYVNFGEKTPFDLMDIETWKRNVRNLDMSYCLISGNTADTIAFENETMLPYLETVTLDYATIPAVKRIAFHDMPNLRHFSMMCTNLATRQKEFSFDNLPRLKAIDMAGTDWGEPREFCVTRCPDLTKINGLNLIHAHGNNLAKLSFEGDTNLAEIDIPDIKNMTAPKDMFKDTDSLKTLVLDDTFEFGQESGISPAWIREEDGFKTANIETEPPADGWGGTWHRDDAQAHTIEQIDISDVTFEDGAMVIDMPGETGKTVSDATTPNLTNTLRVSAPSGEDLPEPLQTLIADKDATIDIVTKSHAFGAVTPCVKPVNLSQQHQGKYPNLENGKAIWTFDIPYDEDNPPQRVEIQMWADSENQKGWTARYETKEEAQAAVAEYPFYAGRITNDDPDNPWAFSLYDKNDQLVEVLLPNARHTWDQICEAAYQSTCLPIYESYFTYQEGWVNYEVPVAPGYYRFDISNTAASKASFESFDEGMNEITLAVNEPNTAFPITLFNVIYENRVPHFTSQTHAFSRMYKADQLKPNTYPKGGLYSFTSTWTGKVWYSNTGYDMFPAMSGTTLNGTTYYDGRDGYSLMPGESFIVREIVAPPGYYDSNAIDVFTYIDGYQSTKFAYYELTYLADGITMENTPSTTGIHSHIEYPKENDDGYSSTGFYGCAVCQRGNMRCICKSYPSTATAEYDRIYLYDDSCSQCGTSSDIVIPVESRTLEVTDMPLPSITVTKLGPTGQPLKDAVLQLIDAETEDVIDEWMSDGTPHTYTFSADGRFGIPKRYEPGTSTYQTRSVIIREAKAPSSMYELVPDQVVTLNWQSGNVSVTLRDSIVSADLDYIARKVDSDTYDDWGQGDSIDWTTFAVEVTHYSTPDCTGEPTASAVFGADDHGRVNFANTAPIEGTWPWKDGPTNVMPVGSYRIREVRAPEGYQINIQSFSFTVTEDAVVPID